MEIQRLNDRSEAVQVSSNKYRGIEGMPIAFLGTKVVASAVAIVMCG